MQCDSENSYAIILAAGNSSRFGAPKQLLFWEEKNFIQQTLFLANSIFNNRVIVVLGAHAEQILETVDQQMATIVINTNWQEGISSSIRIGIEALPFCAKSALMLLSDLPLLKIDSLKKINALWQKNSEFVVASEYHETIGVPAIFPNTMFSELKQLSGDQGAKRLLKKYQEKVLTIPIPEAIMDIDTKQDYQQLLDQNQSLRSNS